jgi:hypothetical protein
MKHNLKDGIGKVGFTKELKPLISKQQTHDRVLTKAETLNVMCMRAIQILAVPKKNIH